MTAKPRDVFCALALAFAGALTSVSVASAQAPASGDTAALPGTPAPEHIQPWGLPPPPPGIGPVSLFADIHDQPQGKFLDSVSRRGTCDRRICTQAAARRTRGSYGFCMRDWRFVRRRVGLSGLVKDVGESVGGSEEAKRCG